MVLTLISWIDWQKQIQFFPSQMFQQYYSNHILYYKSFQKCLSNEMILLFLIISSTTWCPLWHMLMSNLSDGEGLYSSPLPLKSTWSPSRHLLSPRFIFLSAFLSSKHLTTANKSTLENIMKTKTWLLHDRDILSFSSWMRERLQCFLIGWLVLLFHLCMIMISLSKPWINFSFIIESYIWTREHNTLIYRIQVIDETIRISKSSLLKK